MSYMNSVSQKGLEFVTKVTQLLNTLTEEDYRDTYAFIKVQLCEEDSKEERVLGYWTDEIGPGCWTYCDGPPPKKDTHNFEWVYHVIQTALPAESNLTEVQLQSVVRAVVEKVGKKEKS